MGGKEGFSKADLRPHCGQHLLNTIWNDFSYPKIADINTIKFIDDL